MVLLIQVDVKDYNHIFGTLFMILVEISESKAKEEDIVYRV